MSDLEKLTDRELDALFAERVLGFKVTSCIIVTPGRHRFRSLPAQDDNWTMEHPPDRGHILIEGGRMMLPTFTRSLDAAWEAERHFSLIGVHTAGHRHACDTDTKYNAAVERGPDRWGAQADHPARAVVLACLKAVEAG